MTDPQTLDEWRELLKDHPDGIEVEGGETDGPDRWRVIGVSKKYVVADRDDGLILIAEADELRPVRPTLTIEISEDDADWWGGQGWNPSGRPARLAEAIRKAREAQQ